WAFSNVAGLAGPREEFLAEYLRHNERGDEQRVRLFEAASLLTTAASSFRIQRPAWEDEVLLLLDEADRALAGAVPGRIEPPAGTAPAATGVVADPRRWALDAMFMQAVLDPHVRKVYGAEVRGCRVVGKAEGTGLEHIRYIVRGRHRGEKWRLTLSGIPWLRYGVKVV